jgi:hypothetical protein
VSINDLEVVTVPTWSLAASGGIDPGAASGFMAGFGICEIGFAVVFTVLISFYMLKKLLSVAGL